MPETKIHSEFLLAHRVLMETLHKMSYSTFLLVYACFFLIACNTRSINPNNYEGIKALDDCTKIVIEEQENPGFPLDNNLTLQQLIDTLNVDLASLSIEIDKSDYLLTIVSDKKAIKKYQVVLGNNPIDDKLIEGDLCTPEGTFRVVKKYPHNEWSKFILIDYPNEESHRKFNEAKGSGIIPQNSTPGGSIGIHGVPENDYRMNLRINWTAGCISLKNMDINEIYSVIDSNTVVIIKK